MRKKYFFYLLIVVFGLTQIWFTYLLLKYPSFGVNLKQNQDGSWYVYKFDIVNTSDLGLQLGDKIKSLDGIDPNKFPSVIKLKSIDQASKIVIQRSEEELTLNIDHVKKVTDSDIFALCGEILSLLVAITFYKKLSHSPSAKYLSLVFLTVGLTFMSLLASIRGSMLAVNMIGTTVMIIPVSFLQFLSSFLKERTGINIRSQYIKYLYGFIALLFIIQLYTFVNSPISFYITDYTTIILELFVVLGLLLNLVLLGYSYFKYRSTSSVSTLIKAIWLALLVSFAPVICFSLVPKLISNSHWIDPFYTGWFILFFPVTFAYLIATKQIYDIDFILRRVFLTTLISVVPCIVLVGIVSFLLTGHVTLKLIFVLFFLFLLTESLTFYSFEYFTTKLEPIIFPRKHYLQRSLKKIAASLGSVSSFRDLQSVVLADLIRVLDVYGGAIVYKYNDSTEVLTEGDINNTEVQERVESETCEHGPYTVFEVNHHEEYTSYLVMTHKKGNTLLSKEETQWLQLIITYLAVTMENVHLIRKLTQKMEHLLAHLPDTPSTQALVWFRKLTFGLQEKERARIAADLHDTTLQDLFFLRRKLVHYLNEAGEISDTHYATLAGMVADIDRIHRNLRHSCFEINPFLMKDIGLVRTLEQLVQLERETSTFHISFHYTATEDIEMRTMDIKKHVFRIVQELINNAKKHAQAANMRIQLSATATTLSLYYEDDGIGFETRAFAQNALPSGSLGLEQMKSRIASLEGDFQIESSPGMGVKIRCAIPNILKEGEPA